MSKQGSGWFWQRQRNPGSQGGVASFAAQSSLWLIASINDRFAPSRRPFDADLKLSRSGHLLRPPVRLQRVECRCSLWCKRLIAMGKKRSPRQWARGPECCATRLVGSPCCRHGGKQQFVPGLAHCRAVAQSQLRHDSGQILKPLESGPGGPVIPRPRLGHRA